MAPRIDPTTSALIDLALAEDLGTGDLTTDGCVPDDATATARIFAKEDLVVAGVAVAREVFRRVDEALVVEAHAIDGARLGPGEDLFHLRGAARSILIGERLALNFLQRLSGVATFAAAASSALGPDTRCAVVDTRKTTPGFRALEKAAVRAGGGRNHRFGLFDGVLIKENHIAAAGGIEAAIAGARAHAHHLVKVEVEVTTLDELRAALDAGADCVLLDNMSDDQTKAALALIDEAAAGGVRSVLVEASGNVTLERLPTLAALGVDLVSMGALTHSARAVDLSLRLRLDPA